MTPDERSFLTAIQASPADQDLRLVYADWLEERGDCRGEFLRLQPLLKALDPDHLQRSAAEQRYSVLRKGIDASWLEVIDPPHARQNDPGWTCECIEAWHAEPPFPASKFHVEVQDTECDV